MMKGRSQDERVGLALMIVEDLIYGLYPVFTRGLVKDHDPLFVAGVACLAGAVPFWLWLGARGQLRVAVDRRFSTRLILIAIFATTLSSICFFVGTAHTSAANASLLIQSEPIYSLVLSAIFLKEAVSAPQVGATALLLAGAGAVLFQDGLHLAPGDALVLLTPLWYQVGHLIAKKMIPSLPTLVVIPAVRLGVGGALLLALGLALNPSSASLFLDGPFMLKVVAFGLVTVGLEKLIWYQAIARIDLGKASALLVPSVAVGILGAWYFLDEALSAGQAVGLSLMLAGLAWLARSRLKTH